MELGNCLKCMKYSLFALNLLFWFAGSVLVGVGVWSLVSRNALWFLEKSAEDVWHDLIRVAAVALVVIGALLLVVCFLGCFGAAQENACMLATYAAIIAALIVLEVTTGILSVVFQRKVREKLEGEMQKTVQTRFGEEDKQATTDSWDYLQKKFECCGATDGPSEWKDSRWKYLYPDKVVPKSCCVEHQSADGDTHVLNITACRLAASTNLTMYVTYIHSEPCFSAVKDWIWAHSTIIFGIAFGIAALQVFGVIAACCVQREVRNKGTFA